MAETSWSELVETVTSFESWCNIVSHMFEDEIVNEGRLRVLHCYTEDVIKNLRKKENQTENIGETESGKIEKRYIQGILNIPKK